MLPKEFRSLTRRWGRCRTMWWWVRSTPEGSMRQALGWCTYCDISKYTPMIPSQYLASFLNICFYLSITLFSLYLSRIVSLFIRFWRTFYHFTSQNKPNIPTRIQHTSYVFTQHAHIIIFFLTTTLIPINNRRQSLHPLCICFIGPTDRTKHASQNQSLSSTSPVHIPQAKARTASTSSISLPPCAWRLFVVYLWYWTLCLLLVPLWVAASRYLTYETHRRSCWIVILEGTDGCSVHANLFMLIAALVLCIFYCIINLKHYHCFFRVYIY